MLAAEDFSPTYLWWHSCAEKKDPVTRIALRIQCCYICWCWRGAPFTWPALYLLLFATTVAPWQLTNFSSVGDPTLDCMSPAPGLGLQSFREGHAGDDSERGTPAKDPEARVVIMLEPFQLL